MRYLITGLAIMILSIFTAAAAPSQPNAGLDEAPVVAQEDVPSVGADEELSDEEIAEMACIPKGTFGCKSSADCCPGSICRSYRFYPNMFYCG